MAAARTRSRFDREEAGPRNDVYTGLLSISLLAMIGSCVLLYLDYGQYGGAAPKVAVPAPTAPRTLPTGAGATGGGGAAAVVPEVPLPIAAAPTRLPDPIALEASKPVDSAPVTRVSVDLPADPLPVIPAVAEAPAPMMPHTSGTTGDVAPPPILPVIVAPETLPPTPVPAVGHETAPVPLPMVVNEPAPPAPIPVVSESPAPVKQTVPSDPPPLPKSIKQLPN